MKAMRTISAIAVAAVAALSLAPAHAGIRVVTTIKPVHSLVAAVMEGVGEPGLLLDGTASPHVTSLKPSQARILQNADIVFWIGPGMESFLAKSIPVIAANARSVELANVDGVKRLKARTGVNFAEHDNGHLNDELHPEGHAGDDQDAGHSDHAVHGLDTHIWLDPDNAAAFVRAIDGALGTADPANAERYSKNAGRLIAELEALSSDVEAILEPVSGRTFVAFHDAYQHFESRFGVKAAGTIAINPDLQPGADHVRAIIRIIETLGVTCIFSEPQFQPRMIGVLTEETGARTAVLDPLGASLANGPDLYPALIRAMARSMRDCLGGTS